MKNATSPPLETNLREQLTCKSPDREGSAETAVSRGLSGASVTTHTTGIRRTAAFARHGASADGLPGAMIRPFVPSAQGLLEQRDVALSQAGIGWKSTWSAGANGAAASRIPSRRESQNSAIFRGR